MSTIRTSNFGPLTGNTAIVVDPSTPTNGIARVSPLVSFAAVASTSGTSVAFTGIPSWARRITVMLQGVSTTGSQLGIQLGTSSGFVTSGYLGSCGDGGTPLLYSSTFLASPGFGAGGAYVAHGMFILTNVSGNSWVEQHTGGRSDTAQTFYGGGSIALSGTLTQLRLTAPNGTDTFDAGTVNVMYE